MEIGSLVALNHPDWVGTIPQTAKVTRLPNSKESKVIEVPGKRDKRPLMERTLQPSIHLDNILLYNFELNKRAKALKKPPEMSWRGSMLP